MHYKLTSIEGEVLDTSDGRQPLSYLHGHGNIIPGLEKALEGKASGDKVAKIVPAADAYGEHVPELVTEANRNQFPEGVDLVPGMRFQAQTPQGFRVATIISVVGDKISVDANHPLAGLDLQFDVEIVDVREANPEEITHGHVHAEDSCESGSCGCEGH